MLKEIGFCKDIENYLRHLSGRKPGDPPPTLLDYLPPNALMFIDTIPQIGCMYKGDRARPECLRLSKTMPVAHIAPSTP